MWSSTVCDCILFELLWPIVCLRRKLKIFAPLPISSTAKASCTCATSMSQNKPHPNFAKLHELVKIQDR